MRSCICFFCASLVVSLCICMNTVRCCHLNNAETLLCATHIVSQFLLHLNIVSVYRPILCVVWSCICKRHVGLCSSVLPPVVPDPHLFVSSGSGKSRSLSVRQACKRCAFVDLLPGLMTSAHQQESDCSLRSRSGTFTLTYLHYHWQPWAFCLMRKSSLAITSGS